MSLSTLRLDAPDRLGPPERPDLATVQAALLAFAAWLRRAGFAGYDHYDLWATRYGIWSRGLYYRWGKLAAPLVAPLALTDWLAPGCRRWFCPPRRYPMSDAHYMMGFVALHRALGQAEYLDTALRLAEALMASSISGYSGPCWGYPFDWQARDGLCRASTPLVTTTPYVFDAFLDLYDVTGQARFRDYAHSIAEFVARDIAHSPAGKGYAAGYTPNDTSRVVNASAYRAACLARASVLFDSAEYRRMALENVLFVLEKQQPDGSWAYSAGEIPETFVDHMHTCFVLKGLYRTYRAIGHSEILLAVRRGYRYYRDNLFYANGQPRPFARAETTQFRVSELYDYAEALNLALLLQPDFGTSVHANRLASTLLNDWQTPSGYFQTRVSTGGLRNRVPYHRWAQAQTFRSLALYYLQLRMGH